VCAGFLLHRSTSDADSLTNSPARLTFLEMREQLEQRLYQCTGCRDAAYCGKQCQEPICSLPLFPLPLCSFTRPDGSELTVASFRRGTGISTGLRALFSRERRERGRVQGLGEAEAQRGTLSDSFRSIEFYSLRRCRLPPAERWYGLGSRYRLTFLQKWCIEALPPISLKPLRPRTPR